MGRSLSSTFLATPPSIDFDVSDVAWVLDKLAAHAFERNELRQCRILTSTAQLLREIAPKYPD